MTSKPSRANCRATARPIPDVAPVTKAFGGDICDSCSLEAALDVNFVRNYGSDCKPLATWMLRFGRSVRTLGEHDLRPGPTEMRFWDLVANAVVLPLSAWLSRVFRRKTYYNGRLRRQPASALL